MFFCKKNLEKVIIKRASKLSKRIVLPEAAFDKRVMDAAKILTKKKIAKIVIFGNKDEMLAADPKLDLTGIDVYDPKTSEMKLGLSQLLFALRKDKGVTEEKAAEMISDPLLFATLMVKAGYADGMVTGAVSKSADVIRAALQIIKPATGVETVSAAMIMIPTKKTPKGVHPVIIADCSVVPSPTVEQLAEIAIMSAKTAEKIAQLEPRIAFLSYSTKGSGSGEKIDMIKKATELATQKGTEYKIDGELQFDAAISPRVAALKGAEGEVAGKANVLVFPELNAANIGYKIMEYSGSMRAVGPVLQGLSKPVNDLSRGCTVEEIVTTVAITAIQSENK